MTGITQTVSAADLLQHINLQLVGRPGCPGQGALGECAAMDCSASGVWSAYIYLWPAGYDLRARQIADWFTAKGVEVLAVSATLFDPGNEVDDGMNLDGTRPLIVDFALPPPKEA